MARSSMTFILLPFLCLIAEAQNSSTLNCLVDYKELMNCTWKDTGNNSHVSLHVYWKKLLLNNCTFTRLLPAVEEGHFHTYFCTMKITHFTRVYKYTLILKSSSQAKDFTVNNFRPCQNIQLTAPLHLSVTINSTAQNVNISWQFDVPYLSMKVQYELEYWSKETKEDVKMKSQLNDIRHLAIAKADLEPDSHYRGRVRVKPKETFFIRGLWSKWSAEITWRTGPGPNSASTKSNLLCVLFAPLLLAVIIFISLYFKLPSRVVSKVWIHIPNPASYFQPLYNQHNGNFKEWIHKNHASVQRNSSGGSSHELKEVKRVPVGRGVTVILNPWDEAVSNISYLKPIPINQTSTFDLNTKGSLQTEFNNPIQHPKEYSNNDSVLLHLIPQDEQGMSENWAVVHDPSHGTFLGTVPFEEDGGYSYSEEYCTLAHSDCSQGLVPAKVDLQLKVANKCQGEKREVAEDLPVCDDPYLTCLAVTEKSELPQEDCASKRPCITTPLGQSPAEPSEPPANKKEPSLTPAIPDNSAAPSAFLSEALM